MFSDILTHLLQIRSINPMPASKEVLFKFHLVYTMANKPSSVPLVLKIAFCINQTLNKTMCFECKSYHAQKIVKSMANKPS